MPLRNATAVGEFILRGLSDNPITQKILFPIFMLTYITILTGNIVFILLIINDSSLKTPMYFFLTNLAFLDLCFSTSTLPRMLRDLMSVKKIISYTECATQLYMSLSFGAVECILLAIMAYDRYVAICYPLHYTTIMSKLVCMGLAAGSWISGFLLASPQVAVTLNVDLCGNNEINHFFCELPEIISLSCDNIVLVEFIVFVAGVIMLLIPILFIAVSYIKIIFSIFQIASLARQRKAFSTCGSHMIVVTIFYGSAMAGYMKPRSSSEPGTDKVIAIFYTIVPPLLNPIIYTLRNKTVKEAFLKFQRNFFRLFISIR